MYWTDWEEDEIDDSVGRIEKAWMDGFNRQIFVTSKMLWPNGLTLDFHTNTLYWCDAYYDHIEKVFLNGTHRKVKDKYCCFFFFKLTGFFFTEPCCVVLKILSSLFLPLWGAASSLCGVANGGWALSSASGACLRETRTSSLWYARICGILKRSSQDIRAVLKYSFSPLFMSLLWPSNPTLFKHL